MFIPTAQPGHTLDAPKLNQPYAIESAAYNSSLNRLEVTVGPGRADFGRGNDGMVTQSASVTVTLASPAASENYYVYLDDGGTIVLSTSPTAAYGRVRLGRVVTAADKTVATIQDLRGMLPVGLARGLDRGGDTMLGPLTVPGLTSTELITAAEGMDAGVEADTNGASYLAYPRGISTAKVTQGLGYPMAGIVLTVKTDDVVMQLLAASGTNGLDGAMVRWWQVDAWSGWRSFASQDAGFDAATAFIGTTETKTTTGYGDLATLGPSVDVRANDAGRIVVSYGCEARSAQNDTFAAMSVAVASGGQLEIVPSDARAFKVRGIQMACGTWTEIVEGLTPRAGYVVTAKYRSENSGVQAFFAERRVSAWRP